MLLGVVARSTIGADGVYVVGRDNPSGTYHTSGAGASASPGGERYFATLDSTNTEDIADNKQLQRAGGPSASAAWPRSRSAVAAPGTRSDKG